MANSMIKTISFPLSYESEYEYLSQQDNASKYICRLIREDIQNNKMNIKQMVKDIIKQEFGEPRLKVEETNIELSNIVQGILDM